MSFHKSSKRPNKLVGFILDNLVEFTIILVVAVIGIAILNRGRIMTFLSSIAPDYIIATDSDSDSTSASGDDSTNIDDPDSSTNNGDSSSDSSADEGTDQDNGAEPSGDIPAEAGSALSDSADADIAANDAEAEQYATEVITEDNSQPLTTTVSEQDTNTLEDVDSD